MNARSVSLAAVMLGLAAVLVSGCAAEAGQGLLLAQADEEGPTPLPTVASDEQIVSSDGGELVVSPDDDGGEQEIPGGGGAPSADEGDIDWQVYRNDAFHFEIRYPSIYIIVPAPEEPEPLSIQPMAQILFQDQELAQGDTADLEPPRFSIRVFDNSEQLPIEEWLEANEMISSREELSPYSVAGTSGVQACSQLLMAPSCFIYLANESYVIQFTPLGAYSEMMLSGFKLIN